MPLSIAIDGPSGAGKSTIAKALAKNLGIPYLDTGAMYRAMGIKMLKTGLDPLDEEAVSAAAESTAVSVSFFNGEQRTFLDGEDVTESLRSPSAGAAASSVAQWPAVRQNLVTTQRRIAETDDMVLDGRDIGTNVLPGADVKIFLTAQTEIRARRRYDELTAAGTDILYERVLADIQARDARDAGRTEDPLRQSEDAIVVDTSYMTVSEAVDYIAKLCQSRRVERIDN